MRTVIDSNERCKIINICHSWKASEVLNFRENVRELPLMLTFDQVSDYQKNGFVLIEEVFSSDELQSLKNEFTNWVESSREHGQPFGEMLDGRPRFDLEPGHSATHSGLRRVSSPEEISSVYLDLLSSETLLDAVTSLIGDDVRFHHAKINSKLPGVATTVKWHQGFTFDPHSNDDCVTAMLYLDDVNIENGAPRLVPGSHRGPIYKIRRNAF